ncbi:MAG: heme o synthase, partial [Chloroflexota bacterium]|nr:heme o synthase [Chloroflexota bacterium]
SHRYLAVLVGLAVIATGVTALRSKDRQAKLLGAALVPLLVAQSLLGAFVVGRELEAWTVVAHLGLGMSFIATLLALAVHTSVPRRGSGDPSVNRFIGVTAGVVFVQLLLGSWVTGRGAGLAFPDFPLHDGRVIPAFTSEAAGLHFAHRLLAYVIVALVVLTSLRARRTFGRHAPVTNLLRAATALVGLQVVLGALNVVTELHAASVTAHLAVATLIWGSLWSAWLVARRSAGADASALTEGAVEKEPDAAAAADGPRRDRSKVAAFTALTKPRIIELLLVTTLPTMVVAARGIPGVALMLATLVGGALAAGGANTLNMVVDRDIDARMNRTSNRPLVTGEISPRAAVIFALGLELAAFVVLAVFANLLAALLAMSATAFYVGVYTLWLKRRTPQNIVIGGAAGAVPVLVGWAAVTGRVDWAPVVLFAVIFAWTPPHFWALAIKYRDDYSRAEVPMLPSVVSLARTARQILLYTIGLWALTLLFAPVGEMGAIYLFAAVVLGAVFVGRAVGLMRTLTEKAAGGVFRWSLTYVMLLFAAMAADVLVLG